MKKTILLVLICIVVLAGCRRTGEGKAAEKGGFVKVEVPDVCNEITDEFFKVREDYGSADTVEFFIRDTRIGKGYIYGLNFSKCGDFDCIVCERGAGDNSNYFYCNDWPFSKRERDISDIGTEMLKDEEYFYVAEDMVVEYSEDAYEKQKYGQIKTGEIYKVVSRKCYQTDFIDYLVS